MGIDAVVFDLDGVIRHFDPEHRPAVERLHGLADGSLAEAAWDPELAVPVVTGRLTRSQWTAAVGERVGSATAAHQWLSHRGSVDQSMLTLVGELRAVGLSVNLLTNGTDTVADELRNFGIDDRFDRVFNSWEVGVAKPDPEVFEHVCTELGLDGSRCLFTDDRPDNVAGAERVGMHGHHFTGESGLRAALAPLTH